MKRVIQCFKLFSTSRAAVVSLVAFVLLGTLRTYIDTELVLILTDAVNNPSTENIYKIAVVGIIGVAVVYWCARVNTLTKTYSLNDLSKRYVSKLLNCEYDLFVKFNPSKINTVMEFTNNCSNAIRSITYILGNILSIGIISFGIYQIDPSFIIPILCVYGISVPILAKMFKMFDKVTDKIKECKLESNKELYTVIDGFTNVRTFNTQEKHKSVLFESFDRRFKLYNDKAKLTGLVNSFIEVSVYIPTIIAIIQANNRLQAGTISAAEALAIVMYIFRMVNPFVGMLTSLDDFIESSMYLESFDEIMKYGKEEDADATINLDSFESELKFENVSFSYDGTNTVLKDINLSIKKGEKIGICGTSGGGKSTFLKLIPKFYNTTSGSIKIDGIDYADITSKSLRDKINVVHQENFMIDDTIYNNIAYGNNNVSEYQVIEACKKASIYDFIESLPEGFETNVGPRGLKLSGGQKQRIALARIFLNQADIILLDEATSALDTESESIVQESMELMEDKTLIIVAHRLSTIKNCDRIIVIENHTIAEEGTHEELLEKGGAYSRLYLG